MGILKDMFVLKKGDKIYTDFFDADKKIIRQSTPMIVDFFVQYNAFGISFHLEQEEIDLKKILESSCKCGIVVKGKSEIIIVRSSVHKVI